MQVSNTVKNFLKNSRVQALIDMGDWKPLLSHAIGVGMRMVYLKELIDILNASGFESVGKMYQRIIEEMLDAPDDVLTEYDLLVCKYDPVHYFLHSDSKAFSKFMNDVLKSVFGRCKRFHDKSGNTIIESTSSKRTWILNTLEEQSIFYTAVSNADSWDDVFKGMSDFYTEAKTRYST